jgi:3D (Asp-Asp-Asp) domain-containing protein
MHTKITFMLLAAMFMSSPSSCFAIGLNTGETEVKMLAGEPFMQEFIVTAYYSPLPRQCGYVMGDLAADIQLNGRGTNGADGTPVYAGMVAAPPSYPFGTRLVVPRIGTFTVHDRGSAIQEGEATHRLDLWVGSGEEGLARALKFGVQRIKVRVYPSQSERKPRESFDLTRLESPTTVLHPYLTDNATLSDCEAMLAFGKILGKEIAQSKNLSLPFPSKKNLEVADDLRFFTVESGA